jgi:hypothetical protein
MLRTVTLGQETWSIVPHIILTLWPNPLRLVPYSLLSRRLSYHHTQHRTTKSPSRLHQMIRRHLFPR